MASNDASSGPKSQLSIENSLKAAICSGSQPSITKDDRQCRTKVAIQASCACSTDGQSRFDGNGMFYSMGNLIGNSKVGMLFVSFEAPHRLRVQGIATIRDDDELLADFFEAQLIVRVSVTEIFRNCPRYVHRYKKTNRSEYVPRIGTNTPLAAWKRIDDVQSELPAKDQGRAEREGGISSREEYEKYTANVSCGDSDS
jgi:hypothetical protein